MLRKLLFKYASAEKQLERVRRNGTLIGTRKIHSLAVSVYMLHDFFVEVTTDTEEKLCEPIRIFSNLGELQQYIEIDSREKMIHY